MELNIGSRFVISREADEPLLAYVVRNSEPAGGERDVLKIMELRETAVPSQCSLQNIFGLSAAEARLAQALANGDALKDVARTLGLGSRQHEATWRLFLRKRNPVARRPW